MRQSALPDRPAVCGPGDPLIGVDQRTPLDHDQGEEQRGAQGEGRAGLQDGRAGGGVHGTILADARYAEPNAAWGEPCRGVP